MELNKKLFYLKLEIKDLEEEIKSIPDVSGMNYSGMPHSTDVGDPTFNLVLKKAKLEEILNRKKEEVARIENAVRSIEDDEVRAIAEKRIIYNMKWEDIGEQVHLDRTVCSKKVRKYLKNMNLE